MPGAAMPNPVAADKTRWQVFGLEQTAQLDKANGRTRDTIAIVRKCNEREAQVAKALAPRPWWAVWR